MWGVHASCTQVILKNKCLSLKLKSTQMNSGMWKSTMHACVASVAWKVRWTTSASEPPVLPKWLSALTNEQLSPERFGIKGFSPGILDTAAGYSFAFPNSRSVREVSVARPLLSTLTAAAWFHLLSRSTDKWRDEFIICSFPFGVCCCPARSVKCHFNGLWKSRSPSHLW